MKTNTLFLCGVALLAAACSSSSSNPALGNDAGDAASDTGSETASETGSPDTSPSDGNPGNDGGDGAVACNNLANTAQVINIDYIGSDPPAPQGGTIVDGTYLVTASAIYTGVGGPTGSTGLHTQMTLQITGNTVQVASDGQPPTRTVTIATNGVNLTSTEVCPSSQIQQLTYTATPTTLTVNIPAGTFPDGGVKTLVDTFTKQ